MRRYALLLGALLVGCSGDDSADNQPDSSPPHDSGADVGPDVKDASSDALDASDAFDGWDGWTNPLGNACTPNGHPNGCPDYVQAPGHDPQPMFCPVKHTMGTDMYARCIIFCSNADDTQTCTWLGGACTGQGDGNYAICEP